MDVKKFIREVYLAAEPSVDLAKLKEGESVTPREHTIKISEYEKILAENGVECGTGDYVACGFWMLNNGPQLLN